MGPVVPCHLLSKGLISKSELCGHTVLPYDDISFRMALHYIASDKFSLSPAVGFAIYVDELMSAISRNKIELELDYSNTAAYSPREKTVAARWTDKFIDEDTKFERLARLNEQNRKCCLASNKKFIGKTMEVLIENFENHKGKNVITGRTRNNKIVHIPYNKDITGEFVQAKIVGCKTWYLNGELEK
jgi:tRNA-2-methylthio-N6-dimethylallyladenosine synthase